MSALRLVTVFCLLFSSFSASAFHGGGPLPFSFQLFTLPMLISAVPAAFLLFNSIGRVILLWSVTGSVFFTIVLTSIASSGGGIAILAIFLMAIIPWIMCVMLVIGALKTCRPSPVDKSAAGDFQPTEPSMHP